MQDDTPTRTSADGTGGRPRPDREEPAAVTDGGETAVARRGDTGETEVAEPFEPVREIGHDEFDPVGTASLVVLYVAILVAMWVFMYFVEFLGRGPTVIG